MLWRDSVAVARAKVAGDGSIDDEDEDDESGGDLPFPGRISVQEACGR